MSVAVITTSQVSSALQSPAYWSPPGGLSRSRCTLCGCSFSSTRSISSPSIAVTLKGPSQVGCHPGQLCPLAGMRVIPHVHQLAHRQHRFMLPRMRISPLLIQNQRSDTQRISSEGESNMGREVHRPADCTSLASSTTSMGHNAIQSRWPRCTERQSGRYPWTCLLYTSRCV